MEVRICDLQTLEDLEARISNLQALEDLEVHLGAVAHKLKRVLKASLMVPQKQSNKLYTIMVEPVS